ncbi:hypothetical protein F0P96_09225 [Hymenobacter busanensis]|uniref:Uncharacterized protein n=1 Tax=Hymenobacter busanensis TaxID=2607656 RepID=A0A7L4ZZ01_9BACT|nr:hypothetical protein [Hymenobacter busanensis]KAA9333152.1 hypothetical protein F0P96_09225 [Hymenobacter busanensis]QHJ08173.1 hypothetical protein GUY19_13100 [Hymenobacter busanensis]
MKNLLFALLAVALVATAACKKIDQLLTFYIEDSQNFKIPATPLLGQLPLVPIPVTTRSDEKFKNANTAANLVKDVSLDKLTLTVTDPNSANFDFLESITIYISTDGNDRVPLASLNPVPLGQSTIALTPSGAVLDKYIKAQSYTLTTEAKTRRAVAQETSVRIDTRFKITADPL